MSHETNEEQLRDSPEAPARRRRRSSVVVLGAAATLIAILGGLAIAQETLPRATPLAIRTIGQPADDYPTGGACASRIAIDISFGSVCTHECRLDNQCPPGWGCKQVPQGNGEPIGLCFPRRHTVVSD